MNSTVQYCFQCAHQAKGYCKKALELHNEKMPVSGHHACLDHFRLNVRAVWVIPIDSLVKLLTGTEYIYIASDSTVTLVYSNEDYLISVFPEKQNEIIAMENAQIIRRFSAERYYYE